MFVLPNPGPHPGLAENSTLQAKQPALAITLRIDNNIKDSMNLQMFLQPKGVEQLITRGVATRYALNPE